MKFIKKNYENCIKTYSGFVCAMRKRKKHILKDFKQIYKQLLKVYKHIYKLKITESDYFYTINIFNALLTEISTKIDLLSEVTD